MSKQKVIESLIPAILTGILADETGGDGTGSYGEKADVAITDRAFNIAEAVFAVGIKRGCYRDQVPAISKPLATIAPLSKGK